MPYPSAAGTDGKGRRSPAQATAPRTQTDPPFAIAVTLQHDEGGFPLLIQALLAQAELRARKLTVFAAPADWQHHARPILDSIPDEAALDLRLIRALGGADETDGPFAAVTAAAAHLAGLSALEEPVLLVTDVVAQPERDWVRRNLDAIAAGADMVCGAVLPVEPGTAGAEQGLAGAVETTRRYRRMTVALEDRIDPVPWDPAPRHGDESGLSLALRLSCLHRAGGVPEAAVHADRQLIARVRLSGAVIRHSTRCRVRVPHALYLGRALGRSTSGKALPGPMPAAIDPDRLARLYRERAQLRSLLEARLAQLPAAERGRALRATLALSAPAMPSPARSVPLAMALRKLQAREPWQGVAGTTSPLPGAAARARSVGWFRSETPPGSG